MQNLPSKPYEQLVGRDGWVERILSVLRNANAPPIIALTGMGGIGKTALAYEIARRAVADGLFQSALWESAKQYEVLGSTLVIRPEAAVTRENLLNSLARQLGRFEMLQLHPDERHRRLQYILQHNPYLLVVDNLETIEDSRALVDDVLHLLKPSRAILTSRVRLKPNRHLREYQIKGLSELAAINFLRQEAQLKRVVPLANAARSALKRIATATGRLPLAMKFFVAQVSSGITIEEELQRLASADDEETLYRYIYFDLCSRLTIPAQKLLVAIPAFAASVPRFLLQPVAHVSDDEFEPAMGQLVSTSLVEQVEHQDIQKHRYSVHQLTRQFVNSDLRAVWAAQRATNLPA